jgi:hypothetical protein
MLIRVWRRRRTKSFLSWMAHRCRESLQELDQRPSPSDHFVFSKQGPSDHFVFSKQGTQWAWASRGKQRYHEWHQARCKIGGPDYEVGSDALRRACGASWWEGSWDPCRFIGIDPNSTSPPSEMAWKFTSKTRFQSTKSRSMTPKMPPKSRL